MTKPVNKNPLPAIVLAAGQGRRYGGDKLLAQYRARPLIEWTLEKWHRHPLVKEVYLVIQAGATELSKFTLNYPNLKLVENLRWMSGMGTSLAAGIKALPTDTAGVLVGLADTPFFHDDTLTRVVPSARESEFIRVPYFQNTPGHPKYFPSWCFEELLELCGDRGAKHLQKKHTERCQIVYCDDSGSLRDFDHPSDFVH